MNPSEISEKKLSQYEQILDFSSDLITTIDNEYHYLFVNKNYSEYFQTEKERIIGKTISEIIGKNDFQKVKFRIDQCLSGKKISFNMIRNFPKLNKRSIEVNYFPLQIEKGKKNGAIAIIKDVTKRHRTEKKKQIAVRNLRERNKELKLLYRISSIGIRNLTIHEILKKIVKKIPDAWQYSEITCACISYNNSMYKTNNFKRTKWKQLANIEIKGKKEGFIEVCYLAESSKIDEGPFLKEERSLLNAAARLISSILENKLTVKKLRASEKKFRTITQNIPKGLIHIFNKEFEYIYTAGNHELRRLGLKEEDLIGKSIHEIFRPEEAQYIEKYLKQCVETKDIVSFEGPFQESTFLINAIPLVHINGMVNQILALSLNISDRKQMEQLLRESEKQFRRALLELPFPTMLHAEDGEVLIVNEVWTEITGYNIDEIPTISEWTEKAYGKRKELVKEDIQELFYIDKRLDEGIYKVLTKENEKRLWHFSSVPIGKLNDGRKIVLSAALDVTERRAAEDHLKESEVKYRKLAKKLEKKVEERTKKLKAANIKLRKYLDKVAKESQFKTEFLSSVSHELRTPLNAIIGFTELLLEESETKLKSRQREYLNDIHEASGQLLELINSIIDLSQIETGQLKLHITKFRLDNIIKQVISFMKPISNQKALIFECKKNYKLNEKMKADPSRIKQILFNLLSNAIKFTNEGKITLKVTDKPTTWVFEVTDTGIGIKEEDFSTLFEIFGRIDKSDMTEGTGLGLPLVKRLVELHEGEFSFESLYGEGTNFIVTIPK